MKTMMRLLFVSIAIAVSANLYAQNSVSDLFNTYVIVPAQQRIQILTDELNYVNDQIQNSQAELSNSNSASTSPDAGGDADAVNPPSPLIAQIAELQSKASELQNGLTWWQTQLALWQTFNALQQEQYLLSNSVQILAATGQNMASLLTTTSQNNHLGPMPDANNPWVVPVFVSTGDSEKDTQLIQEWLVQHGLMKNE